MPTKEPIKATHNHLGYAAVVDGAAVGYFDKYDPAYDAAKGGIVVRIHDLNTYGYAPLKDSESDFRDRTAEKLKREDQDV